MIKILVIDDDRHMRTACSRVLTAAGWSVVCAEDGAAGIREIEKGEPPVDAVLVDHLMPRMNGTEVMERAHALRPGLPVIVMTGYLTEDSAKEIKDRGAFECLQKPFTPEQLREALQRALP